MSSWQESFDIVNPSWMENWYDQLQDLTIRSSYFRMSQQEFETVWRLIDGLGGLAPSFYDKATACMQDLKGDKFFFRLGSRSPKDNCVEVKNGADINFCMSDSMRVMEDLLLCEKVEYLPYVFLREWKDIPQKYEFRCFVKDGELKGITQYFYDQNLQYLHDKDTREDIVKKAEKLLAKILPRIELQNFIFDIAYQGVFEPALLIEINPFSSWTDPCLFDWATEDWSEFKFKYVNEL